jgi:hypothetical protein
MLQLLLDRETPRVRDAADEQQKGQNPRRPSRPRSWIDSTAAQATPRRARVLPAILRLPRRRPFPSVLQQMQSKPTLPPRRGRPADDDAMAEAAELYIFFSTQRDDERNVAWSCLLGGRRTEMPKRRRQTPVLRRRQTRLVPTRQPAIAVCPPSPATQRQPEEARLPRCPLPAAATGKRVGGDMVRPELRL